MWSVKATGPRNVCFPFCNTAITHSLFSFRGVLRWRWDFESSSLPLSGVRERTDQKKNLKQEMGGWFWPSRSTTIDRFIRDAKDEGRPNAIVEPWQVILHLQSDHQQMVICSWVCKIASGFIICGIFFFTSCVAFRWYLEVPFVVLVSPPERCAGKSKRKGLGRRFLEHLFVGQWSNKGVLHTVENGKFRRFDSAWLKV